MPIHIAFEGIDSSGKTTLCTKLQSALSEMGKSSLLSKEFSTEYGELLKQRLYSETKPSPCEKALAFALDRLIRLEELQHCDADFILWDRYTLSSTVYRLVEGIDNIHWVQSINSLFPKPDFYFYIDVSIDEVTRRNKENSRPCPYSIDFLSRCRDEYMRLVDDGELLLLTNRGDADIMSSVLSLLTKRDE